MTKRRKPSLLQAYLADLEWSMQVVQEEVDNVVNADKRMIEGMCDEGAHNVVDAADKCMIEGTCDEELHNVVDAADKRMIEGTCDEGSHNVVNADKRMIEGMCDEGAHNVVDAADKCMIEGACDEELHNVVDAADKCMIEGTCDEELHNVVDAADKRMIEGTCDEWSHNVVDAADKCMIEGACDEELHNVVDAADKCMIEGACDEELHNVVDAADKCMIEGTCDEELHNVNNNVGNVPQTSYEFTAEAFGDATRRSRMDSVHISYEFDDQTFEAVENILKPVNYKNKLIDMDISESDTDPDYVDNSMSESDISEVYSVYDVLKSTPDKLTPTSDTPKSLDNVSQTPSETAESTCNATDQVSPCSIYVNATNNVGSRKYDKKFYCVYCKTPQAKLPRHLLTQHKDEVEVAKYEATADKYAKIKMICRLRNLGNHQHNTEVIKQGFGELVVAYRPDKPSSWEDYVPCEYCMGYYIHWDLWKHVRRCPLKPVDCKSSGRVVANSRLLLPVPDSASDTMKIVLTTFSSDAVSRLVKTDPLILQLGEKLCLRLGHDRENFSTIRNTLRELGRLLKQLRESVGLPDGNLGAFIDPLYFQNVVSSARHIAGFSEKTHLFTTPSLALKLGHSLKKCSKILKGNALQSGDEGLLKKSVSFWELCEMTWCEEVSTHALRTLGEKKRNKVKLIPLTKDCQALSRHLKEFGKTAYQALELCKSNKEAWCDLCAVSLTQVILFNRRRQGEASKMTLDDFEGKHSTGETDVTNSLSPLEQQLCRVLTIIEIVGKRGRTVPVILTAEMKKWINLLIESRQSVGINEANKFVFARANYGSMGHIRGCDCLRNYSEECGAEFPKLLRSTHLRKQIATLSQLLNLKENELDILANFLGHDIRVHREFYRLPEHTLQIAKVSKLLFTLENGQFADQCGKSLDEITVDADEDIGVEVDNEEDSEDSEEELSPVAQIVNQTRKRPAVSTKSKGSSKPKVAKRGWSEQEKAAVMQYFDMHVHLGKLPVKKDIVNCLEREGVLRRRTWRNIKDFVRNKIRNRLPNAGGMNKRKLQ